MSSERIFFVNDALQTRTNRLPLPESSAKGVFLIMKQMLKRVESCIVMERKETF